MLSNICQLLIANFNTLSDNEKFAVMDQLNKTIQTVSKTVPKKQKFDIEAMKNEFIAKHRAKHQAASKLA